MSDPITPVDKQAALFLSRKKPRIETIEEAFAILADKLRAKELSATALDLIENCGHSDNAVLVIGMTIRKDMRSPGLYAVEMHTQLRAELSREAFYGLG